MPFLIDPLFILFCGILTVIGMIVVLRVNAFLSLLAAAFLVSFMTPIESGNWGDKVLRVANGFGTMAAKIGILIAMGSVIGKCMIDSGSADRIIKSLRTLFGERLLPASMLSGGFILSVPVFYEATFYLMVPIAKSVYRATKKNYLLYLMAIGLGATMSHTLVPPTPGPVAAAMTLNVPIGTMMLVGALVGILTAPFALGIASVMNRLLPNPEIHLDEDLTAEPQAKQPMPATFLAYAPILVPVVLIAAGTIYDMFDKGRYIEESLREFSKIVKTLELAETTLPISKALEEKDYRLVSSELKNLDSEMFKSLSNSERQAMAAQMQSIANEIKKLNQKTFYEATQRLSDAFKNGDAEQCKSASDTLADKIDWAASVIEPRNAGSTAALRNTIHVLGNPQMAMIVAALVAMTVLAHVRSLSFRELERRTETALLDAGLIILIVSAGGAFGEMLRAANVGDAVKDLFQAEAGLTGALLLCVAFGITAMIKTAQGSSTAAMITTAAIFSGIVFAEEAAPLPYNVAYLAVAIGLGSCVTGWMNDGGFWLFCRIGGIKETDALKTWTVGLVFLGLFGLFVVLVLSQLLPLT